MPSKVGDFFIEIGTSIDTSGLDAMVDKIEATKNRTKNVTTGLNTMGLAFTAAAAAGAAVILQFSKAFGVQEQAQARLTQAFKTAGKFSEAAIDQANEYAQTLQKITTFDDEAIAGAQAMLVTFGAEGEMLDKLTKATLDLAAAKGMDLQSAADLVAKSIGSSTNALARYGIAIEGAAGSTKRMEMAVSNISNLFEGAATAQANTYLGQIEQLKNSFGDLQESIGQYTVPTLQKLTGITKEAIDVFQGMPEQLKKDAASVLLFGTAIGSVLGPLMMTIAAIPRFVEGIVQMTGAMNALRVALLAHPVYLIAVALGGASVALAEYLNLKADQRNAEINTGKTAEDMILLHKKRIKELREELIKLGETNEDTARRSMIMAEWRKIDNAIAGEQAKVDKANAEEKKRQAEAEVQRMKFITEEEQKKADAIAEINNNLNIKLIEINQGKAAADSARAQAEYDKAVKDGADKTTAAQVLSETLQQIEVDRVNAVAQTEADHQAKLLTIIDAGLAQQKAVQEEKLAGIKKAVQDTAQAYRAGFGAAFSDMIIKGKDFSTSMAGVWENMKEVFLRAVGEMIAKWALLTAVQMITGIPTASIAKFLNFQMGGVVPGPIGQPALVVAHGGEEFSGVGKRLQRENVNFEIANTINVTGEASDSAIAKITQAVEEGNMRAIQMAKALYNQGKLLEGETS